MAAAGYARSLVREDESSFQTMDMNTAFLTEEAEEAQMAAEGADSEEGGIAALAETGGTSVETADSGMMGRMADAPDSAGTSDEAVLEDAEIAMAQENVQLQQMSECRKEQKYASYETFAEEHAIPLALPDESLPGELKQEEYILMGENSLLVRLETEESVLLLHQSYYGNLSGHASEEVYPGGVCNERTYTTLQGFAYKLVDSSNGEEIHAAVAVGDYELMLDFYGYTEKEIHEVLEDMDLSVYL